MRSEFFKAKGLSCGSPFFMSRFLSVVNQFKRYSADNAHHDGNRDCDDNDQRVPFTSASPMRFLAKGTVSPSATSAALPRATHRLTQLNG